MHRSLPTAKVVKQEIQLDLLLPDTTGLHVDVVLAELASGNCAAESVFPPPHAGSNDIDCADVRRKCVREPETLAESLITPATPCSGSAQDDALDDEAATFRSHLRQRLAVMMTREVLMKFRTEGDEQRSLLRGVAETLCSAARDEPAVVRAAVRAHVVEDVRMVFELTDRVYEEICMGLPQRFNRMSEGEKQPWLSRAAEAHNTWENDRYLWENGRRDAEPMRPKSAYFLWIEKAQKQIWAHLPSSIADQVA